MHRIEYTIRRILPAQLPTTDPQALLNLDIVPLGNDLYSCAEQFRSDDDVDIVEDASGRRERRWHGHGDPKPGERLTAGRLKDRYAQLPAADKAKVLRARVFRARDPKKKAKQLIAAKLASRSGAADILEEARQSEELEQLDVAMANVDPDDIVEEQNVIPHRWAGER